MNSYKTTAGGLLALVGSLITLCLVPQFDGDPATIPAWGEWVTLALPIGLGLIAARDHGVTSEQAGLVPPK